MLSMILLWSCSPTDGPDVLVLDEGMAAMSEDLGPDHDLAQTEDPDMDMPPDSKWPDLSGLPTEFNRFEIDATKWPLLDRCAGETPIEQIEQPFELPSDSDRRFPVTAESIRGERLGSFNIQLNEDYRSQPVNQVPDYAFVTNDEDLSIRVNVSLKDPDFRFAMFDFTHLVMNLTVLVDFSPAPDATIIRWNNERTEKLGESQGGSMVFGVETEVESFDFVIPRATFAEERSYEIAILFNPIVPGFHNSARHMTIDLEVFNGSYQRPTRPCSEPWSNEPLEPIEADFVAPISLLTLRYPLLAFPESMPSPDTLFFSGEPVPAAPGERVRIYTSFLGSSALEAPFTQPIMPLLDGEPLLDRAIVLESPEDFDESQVGQRAFWRASFDVVMPEQTGVHFLQVASWPDIRARSTTINGENFAFPSGFLTTGSNVISFDVQ